MKPNRAEMMLSAGTECKYHKANEIGNIITLTKRKMAEFGSDLISVSCNLK